MLTPQFSTQKLAQALGLAGELYIKREDLHPYGSHKGRSIPPMIEKYAREGVRDFVISSSGNAALAAVFAVQAYNKQLDSRFRGNDNKELTLTIFTGKNINPEKYQEILRYACLPVGMAQDDIRKNISLHKLDNPRQSAFQVDQAGDAKLLRQSTDDSALIGYDELAHELGIIRNLTAVFVPTSSGTTAQGLHEAFVRQKINPQIHIVQTDFCHALCENGDLLDMISSPRPSLADAIVDQVGRRKNKIAEAMVASGGKCWIATNAEIAPAIEIIQKNTGIEVSPNSALSVAGLVKAIAAGIKFPGAVVCIFTGK